MNLGDRVVMDLLGFTGSGTALFAITTARASSSFLGGTLLVNPTTAVAGQAVVSGDSGMAASTIPSDPAFVGVWFLVQFAMRDSTPLTSQALTNGHEVSSVPDRDLERPREAPLR